MFLSFRPFVRLGSGLFLAGVSFIASALLQLAIDVSFAPDISEISVNFLSENEMLFFRTDFNIQKIFVEISCC